MPVWQARSSELLRRQKRSASKCLAFSVTLHLLCGSLSVPVSLSVLVDQILVVFPSFRSIPLARCLWPDRGSELETGPWTLNNES
ncbi:hypothetical protein M440DRAFT_1396794 [Trichoderma longibrachiatum ATCC 18648]|uniref:Uncharacterized protein n=1 Tax=Trichoderma longibrachiatum ATCC 18648 TaxID=983965 RepID=A0A2T4CJE4_TRILO|nr:hypothetical protein M440DRAFT_1396794 [Trichoderma longibrachiatum ATCC 18648]